MSSYLIPASARQSFAQALEKMNRRAARLGCDTLSITSEISTSLKIDGITYPALEIEISGLMPSYKGWFFVASVETLDTGKSVFHGENTGTIPAHYKTSGHACEHCNQSRRRNASYILQSGSEFKQVGSTCINDFLGGNRLPHFEFVKNTRESLREFEDFSTASICHASVMSILIASAATIRANGFVKKTGHDIYGGTTPTALLVESYLCDRRNPKRFQPTITEADEEKAEAVRNWLVNHESTQSDYLQKLIDLAAASMVHVKNIGIIASAIVAHDRELEKQAQAAASPSNHVGTIGKRETFVVTLSGSKVLPDYGYGCSNLYTFKDASGNVIKWKTSNSFEFNGTVRLTGSVKKHGEWNGVKETELTRCKVA